MISTNKDINRNVKDNEQKFLTLHRSNLRDMSIRLPYGKINKLITALYMVTDIIDKEEPIRNKLRTLGAEIISDISNVSLIKDVLAGHIDEIMSFLDIASTINFISEMNCAILKKEFTELKESVQESIRIRPAGLEEFLKEEQSLDQDPYPTSHSPLLKRGGSATSKGHARIGVQKGSTLLKAIKDMSDRIPNSRTQEFKMLKEKRRYEIINFIKNNQAKATITDIKSQITLPGSALNNIGEKTLQRELMSMIRDGVLYKEGSKRWTLYNLIVS